MFSNELIFLGLIFIAVILLSQALFMPVYSPQRANTSLVRKRLKKLAEEADDRALETSLLRENKLKKISKIGRALEKVEFIDNLSYRLELADYRMMGHHFFLLSLLSAIITGMATWYFANEPIITAIVCVATIIMYHFKLTRDTNKRMDLIEASFPDALDVIRRALQAGYSFSDAIKLSTEEMEGPIAKEFRLMFANLNYSKDVKRALLGFIERVPSVSAMAFASAVMVQKETGGNLAENIESLSRVIREVYF